MPPRSSVTVTKQNPTDNGKPRTKLVGRLLDQAIDVADIEDIYIKMLLYGGNRVGKTTLAAQFTKPLLHVAFEMAPTGGARSIKKVPGIKYLRLDSTEAGMQLAKELKNDDNFQTVVIDSVTSYQDIVLKEILNLPEVPTQLNWGAVTRDEYRVRSERTREGLRPFADLAKHTVFIGKERDHNPPDKEKPEILRGMQSGSFFAVDLGGATVGWLQDCCDFICRMYMEEVTEERMVKSIAIKGQESKERKELIGTGKFARFLRLNWHDNYAAGFRCDTPTNIPDVLRDPTFAKLETLIRGGTVK